MKPFLLYLCAVFPVLLPSCITLDTASQTLDSGTVYRTWNIRQPEEGFLKDNAVFIMAEQCDQRKKTPVIGSPSAQIEDGSHMEDIPGTKTMVFLQMNRNNSHDSLWSNNLIDFLPTDKNIVAHDFPPKGARKVKLSYPGISTPAGRNISVRMQKTIQSPSTGRRILAGVQTCLIDIPGTIVANAVGIPAGVAAAPFVGLYTLCSGGK